MKPIQEDPFITYRKTKYAESNERCIVPQLMAESGVGLGFLAFQVDFLSSE